MDVPQGIWLIPVLPLTSAIVLGMAGRRWSENAVTWVACGSVGLAAVLVLSLLPVAQTVTVHVLRQWFDVAGFSPRFALRLDPLAWTMAFVVTVIGFFIHLYSSDYMAREPHYARYFAWLNLFVAAMLLLVLADDLLLLFIGWEGVGLCSYLLIGFWYREPGNGAAARKAFVMTRAGDTALLLGLLLLFTQFGTSRIDALLDSATQTWTVGGLLPTIAALLLLAGAVGKSAQLPLQTWLPDAMAGPTPVSALIHAATMVTAGVYLIARMHPLFALAPAVLDAIAWLGAATLLLAALSALVQNDIKRVLAYSTISQIGFMFLALGVGAWTGAIFHLFTHAFFKALLFLATGAVIVVLGHEQDIRRMGGMRRELPWAFWGFLAGALSLAALPLIAGWFSKDLILARVWQNSPWLWAIGWFAAFVTACYATRVFVMVFLGATRAEQVQHQGGWRTYFPIAVLSVFALGAGWLQTPGFLGGADVFASFVAPVLGEARGGEADAMSWLTSVAPVLGVIVTYYLLRVRPAWGDYLRNSPTALRQVPLWFAGFEFDRLYDYVFRRPYVQGAARLAPDPANVPFATVGRGIRSAWLILSRAQNGHLRRYAAVAALGAVLLLAAVLP